MAVVTLSEGLAMNPGTDGIGVTRPCPGPTRADIREQINHAGSERITMPPDPPAREPPDPPALLIDAVRENRFLVSGNEEVRSIHARHGVDPDGFLAEASACSQAARGLV